MIYHDLYGWIKTMKPIHVPKPKNEPTPSRSHFFFCCIIPPLAVYPIWESITTLATFSEWFTSGTLIIETTLNKFLSSESLEFLPIFPSLTHDLTHDLSHFINPSFNPNFHPRKPSPSRKRSLPARSTRCSRLRKVAPASGRSVDMAWPGKMRFFFHMV